ncbi:MAG: head GIN domain-containing protein [Pseudomonadales bacterium]
MNGLRGLILLLAAAAACPAAAETENRDVAPFDRVAFALPGTLTLERGEAHRVTVEALPEDLERIETRVSGSELTLAWKAGRWFWHQGPEGEIRVRVVLPALTALALNGSGDVDAGSWRSDRLAAELRGSGDLRFADLSADEMALTIVGSGNASVTRLDAGRIRVRVDGSGDVVLAGTATAQEIEVRGSGNVDAVELEGVDVSVEVLGSGDVEVWSSGRLTADVRGSGDVRYRGEPELESKQRGSGEVRPL